MVITSAIILSIHAFGIYSFGIFLKPVTTDLNWDRGALSVAISLSVLVGGALGIFAGRLSDKYGPRFLVTTNGLLSGAGFILLSQMSALWHAYLILGLLMAAGGACVLVPVTSTIPRWFAQKRGVAMGLTWTGIGLGGVFSPILAQWLISSYGWRQAYIVLGLITMITVTLLAQFMKRDPQQMGLQAYGKNEAGDSPESQKPPIIPRKELSLQQAIRTGHFWILGTIVFCFIFIHNIMLAHIASHISDIGISATIAASTVSIFAGTSLIGRNLGGFLADKVGIRQALIIFLIAMTLVVIWLNFALEAWMFYLFAIIYGVAYGGIIPLETLISEELFGLKSLGEIFAGILLLGMTGGAVSMPLAGYIFDITGSYSIAFIICVAFCAIALTLGLILLRWKDKSAVPAR